MPRPLALPVPRVVLLLVDDFALRETDRLVTDALLLALAAWAALAAARWDCAL